MVKPPSKIRIDSRPKLKGKDVRLQKELDDFMVGMPGLLLGGQEFLGTRSSEDFKRYCMYTHYTSLDTLHVCTFEYYNWGARFFDFDIRYKRGDQVPLTNGGGEGSDGRFTCHDVPRCKSWMGRKTNGAIQRCPDRGC